MMQPFRFGVTLWQAPSRTAWQDKARKLEALGYAVLHVPDHLEHFLAPLPALVSAADATTQEVVVHAHGFDFAMLKTQFLKCATTE